MDQQSIYDKHSPGLTLASEDWSSMDAPAVERPRHKQGSLSQILAVAFRRKFSNLFKMFPLRSTAASHLTLNAKVLGDLTLNAKVRTAPGIQTRPRLGRHTENGVGTGVPRSQETAAPPRAPIGS